MALIFIVVYIGAWLVGLGYLLSCANVNFAEGGSQIKYINLVGKDYLKWQIAVFVFGLFWIVELLQAIFKFMLIVGVCTWYFTSTHDSRGRFSIFKGLWWAIRYNFGSLALGSFILAIIWTIRVIFEYLEKKTKNLFGDNAAANCLKNFIRCCLACFHRFVKFLNDNAYIQIALTGQNFCSSAMASFSLALKHSGSFFITNGIGMLISMLGKLSIAIGNTLIGYLMLSKIETVAVNLESPIGPLVIIFLISYVMATIFMTVYSTTSLAILQCLYADVDICDQSGGDKFESSHRPREMEPIVNMLRKTPPKPKGNAVE